jgi:pilus assembly protein Flp/PilA
MAAPPSSNPPPSGYLRAKAHYLHRKELKMKTLVQSFADAVRSFAKDEEGAQVVEYALIIAVVSIALVAALAALAPGGLKSFTDNVTNCLSGTGTCKVTATPT